MFNEFRKLIDREWCQVIVLRMHFKNPFSMRIGGLSFPSYVDEKVVEGVERLTAIIFSCSANEAGIGIFVYSLSSHNGSSILTPVAVR